MHYKIWKRIFNDKIIACQKFIYPRLFYRDSAASRGPPTWASKGSPSWRWSRNVSRISPASGLGSPAPGWSPSPGRRSDVRRIRIRIARAGSTAATAPDAGRRPRSSAASRKCPRSSIHSRRPDPRSAASCDACSSLACNRRSLGSLDPSQQRSVSSPGSCASPSWAPRSSRNTMASSPWWSDRAESGASCA